MQLINLKEIEWKNGVAWIYGNSTTIENIC